MWYRIVRTRIFGGTVERATEHEVRGESSAANLVDRLNAKLSDEDRVAGWHYLRDNGSMRRKGPVAKRRKTMPGMRVTEKRNSRKRS